MSTFNALTIYSLFVAIVFGRITIELTPHKLTTPIPYQISNTFILAKSSTNSPSTVSYATSNDLSSAISINLTNSLDRIYTGQISIGTPSSQTFHVVFDTGSADLWIFSAQHTCTIAEKCNDATWTVNKCSTDTICCFFDDIMNAYDHNQSTTYTPYTGNDEDEPNWSITYGKGSASGYLSQDTITIGGLTAENQIFAEATYWSDLLISCAEPMSGILGFAMKAASEDHTNTVIESLYTQNKIESKLFSVSLKGNDEISELIIGDPDPDKYNNDIIWGDIIQPLETGMWFTQLTGIIYSENNNLTKATNENNFGWLDTCIDTAPCLALIDTGTSYITMPSTNYNTLLQYLEDYTSANGANCFINSENGVNTFVCVSASYSPDDDLPFLWFQIGGYALRLSPSQYMLSGTDSCLSSSSKNGDDIGYDCMGISALDSMGSNTYILGDVFLRQYYVIFDESNYRVGVGAMDEVYIAMDRPSINEFWRYVEFGAMLIGAIGVLTCIIVSCWKLKKPSNSQLWDKQRLISQQNEAIALDQNLFRNDNRNGDNIKGVNKSEGIPQRKYKSPVQKKKKQPFLESNVVTVMEIDAEFDDTDDENDKVVNVLNVNSNDNDNNLYQRL